jgi:hypothetical protein
VNHSLQTNNNNTDGKQVKISQCRGLGSKKAITGTKFASILGKIK